MRVVRSAALPVFAGALLVFGWTYDVPGPAEPPLSDAEIGWVAAASSAGRATAVRGRAGAVRLARAPAGAAGA